MKQVFAVLVTMFVVIGALGQSPKGSGLSPQEVIDRLWKKATAGELLTSDGWNRASGFFLHMGDFPGNNTIRVVSNDWAVGPSFVRNDTAEIDVGYIDAGSVDSSLRYSAPPKTIAYKTAIVFHLVFAPTKLAMFKSDGKTIIGKEEREGPTEWQIKESAGTPWTTVNTAIRYVLENREKSTDPTIRRNADATLAELLRLH